MDTPQEYPPMRRAIKSDVIRYYGRYRFWLLVNLFLFDRTFRPICTLRLCQAASKFPGVIRELILFPLRTLHHLTQQLAAVDLPWRTRIGPGFRLTHGWGTVVSPGAAIGSNVTLFHGVTIGQKDDITIEGRETTYPRIEDEVWIGPHAVIIGGAIVGRGCRIAPGTIVIEDVEHHSIVAGNPAKVIATNTIPDVVFPVNIDTPEKEQKTE